MIANFDIKNLNDFLRNFYVALGVKISVFGDEFNLVTEYPIEMPAFCSLVRSVKDGASGCKNCDVNAFKIAREKRDLHIYTCHAGLIEAVAPIKLGGGILGYVILAQMLPEEDFDVTRKNAIERVKKYGITEDKIIPAINGINKYSSEKITAFLQIFNAVVAYLQVNDLVKWKDDDIANKISDYIDLNLISDLSGDVICKKFLISRTKLYQIAKKSYGMSISRYVLCRRVEQAKQLLKEKKSINEVSYLTGFADANYFSKIFKKHVGVSPTDYKAL
jgi:AraC-like DNA-binding protein